MTEKDFDIKKEFDYLIKNKWLSPDEAKLFMADRNLVECMELSTSPIKHNIFNALKLVSKDNVRVVILGKDPYPNPKDAHGLAFSSLNTSTPDSLKNIFKAIDSAYGSHLFERANNNLTNWAKNGVLLLNTGLTYQRIEGEDKKERDRMQAQVQNTNMKVWKPFVKLIIKRILEIKDRRVVMLLWGNDAHNIVFGNIDNKDFKENAHLRDAVIVPDTSIMLLQSSHPSPLSVNRGGDFPTTAPEHFRICNDYLGQDKVNWCDV